MPVKRIPLERHEVPGTPVVDKGEDVAVASKPPAKKVSSSVSRTPKVKDPVAKKTPAKKPVAKKPVK